MKKKKTSNVMKHPAIVTDKQQLYPTEEELRFPRTVLGPKQGTVLMAVPKNAFRGQRFELLEGDPAQLAFSFVRVGNIEQLVCHGSLPAEVLCRKENGPMHMDVTQENTRIVVGVENLSPIEHAIDLRLHGYVLTDQLPPPQRKLRYFHAPFKVGKLSRRGIAPNAKQEATVSPDIDVVLRRLVMTERFADGVEVASVEIIEYDKPGRRDRVEKSRTPVPWRVAEDELGKKVPWLIELAAGAADCKLRCGEDLIVTLLNTTDDDKPIEMVLICTGCDSLRWPEASA